MSHGADKKERNLGTKRLSFKFKNRTYESLTSYVRKRDQNKKQTKNQAIMSKRCNGLRGKTTLDLLTPGVLTSYEFLHLAGFYFPTFKVHQTPQGGF